MHNNNIWLSDSVLAIVDEKNEKITAVIVDASMSRYLKQFQWCITDNGYVFSSKGYLHRIVMDVPEGMEVDHEDGCKTNCQTSNLRICTRQQNLQNRAVFKSNTLGIKNVSLCTMNKGSHTYVKTQLTDEEGKPVVRLFSVAKLGLMPAVRDASIAARALREQLHGQYACH